MDTIINENGISYVLASDGMYYPALKYDTTEPHYKKYGLLQTRLPQKHPKEYYVPYYFKHINHTPSIINENIAFLLFFTIH